MTRFLIAVLVSLCVVGCSRDKPTPTAPSPPPPANIAGSWTGTFESNNWAQQAITLSLTQAGSGVNGTWAVEVQSWTGTISGTTDPSTFSGSFTINARSVTGGACTGTASFSGSAGASTMTWTSPGFSSTCTGMPAGIRVAMQRR